MLIDQAGVHVGVDGHLLAGEGVEREARRDLRGAYRAMCDDEELDRDQREEEHEAYDVVAADDKLPEGLDDGTGGLRAFVSMQQDAAAGGDVEAQAEQRE